MALFVLYCLLQFAVPVDGFTASEVRIEKGASFGKAVGVLKGYGLVRDEKLFIFMGKITGLEKKLKHGYYAFGPSTTPWKVFMALLGGKTMEESLTIVEGDSLSEIERKLARAGVSGMEDFGRLATDRGLLRELNVYAPSIEGYLFPDTYKFPKGTTIEEVFVMAVRRLWEKYDSGLFERTHELGLDVKGVLTLASIIEREAAVDGERPLISAVFHNRLKKGVPLQADPTAIYGVKPFSAGVRKSDLLRENKYNTYVYKGLPPGPIASAGIKSIRAALYPADVPYLYFVSNNDGTHTFSTTLREHQRAVEAYRMKKEEAAALSKPDAG